MKEYKEVFQANINREKPAITMLVPEKKGILLEIKGVNS